MHAVFMFNRAFATNASKHNFAEGLDLKKTIQVILL